jgi:hypothetical protein
MVPTAILQRCSTSSVTATDLESCCPYCVNITPLSKLLSVDLTCKMDRSFTKERDAEEAEKKTDKNQK